MSINPPEHPRRRRPASVPSPACDGAELITILAGGPRTLAELARLTGRRPSCVKPVTRRLVAAKAAAWHERRRAPEDKRSEWVLALLMDPFRAWHVLRGTPPIVDKNARKPLHGSLLYEHNQLARLGGPPPPSNSPPAGEPEGGPANNGHKL